MGQDGFATFISDDLPGFNSLNGSGFFDTTDDWNDLSDGSDDGFGGDDLGFEVVRAAHTEGDDTKKEVELDLEVFFSDDEEEEAEDEAGGSLGKASAHKDENAAPTTTTKRRSKTGSTSSSSSRRKPTSSPSDAKRRVRRHQSADTAEDSLASASSKHSAKSTRSSASQQLRRARTTGNANEAPLNPRRASTAACRARRRSEHLKKSGLDLGAKLEKKSGLDLGAQLNKLEKKEGAVDTPAKKAVACDEQSVGSRHSVSSKGGSGRRGDRRRRATQGSELLARNLQQFTAASTLVPVDPYRHSLDDSLQGGKEEAWKSRRRRAENLALAA